MRLSTGYLPHNRVCFPLIIFYESGIDMAVMSEAFLQSADGTTLFYREWLVDDPCGAVLMVHGLGEHGGRYVELAGIFNAMGLSVRIQDHRGHGRSGGARGSIAQSHDFLHDLKLAFDDFAKAQRTVPFLFGHSLGGLIAARFATGGFAQVRGLMLSSPALAIYLSGFQRLLLALGSVLAPGLAVASGLPPDAVSHDDEVQRNYGVDELNHRKVAPRVVRFMLDAMAHSIDDAALFTTPVLLQFAGKDLLVDPVGAERFYAKLPAAHKTRHRYEDAFHEIFNEALPLRHRVQQDLIVWMREQLESKSDQ
ncbi:MAG: lysophospholipase [Herbaspirillum sp.]|nr:lysophospholipase [Herbaspirillum sp.]